MDLKSKNDDYIKITLRQEYVLLTGDYKKAILLEYFMHMKILNGDWFNLSYDNISKNSLLGLHHVNIRRHIKYLIAHGWILRQKDEDSLTYRYNVNIEKINEDLEKIKNRLNDRLNERPAA